MEINQESMPKAVITSAILIIFLHWSGASLTMTSANIWLGTVQIERGWMIGVFLHLWFIMSFVLYWQHKGAKNLTEYENINKKFQHIQLIRNTPSFLDIVEEACIAAENEYDTHSIISAKDLALMVKNREFTVKVGERKAETILPTIYRDWKFSYKVDFSKASHVESSISGSGIDDDKPDIKSMPCYDIPYQYSLKLFLYELSGFGTVVLKNFTWHQEFLPWLLAWFAVCSLALGIIGWL